jgi:hypothetical protein
MSVVPWIAVGIVAWILLDVVLVAWWARLHR